MCSTHPQPPLLPRTHAYLNGGEIQQLPQKMVLEQLLDVHIHPPTTIFLFVCVLLFLFRFFDFLGSRAFSLTLSSQAATTQLPSPFWQPVTHKLHHFDDTVWGVMILLSIPCAWPHLANVIPLSHTTQGTDCHSAWLDCSSAAR